MPVVTSFDMASAAVKHRHRGLVPDPSAAACLHPGQQAVQGMRPALLFTVDQGFYYGSIAANWPHSEAALRNVWASLQPLLARYDVVLGFTPIHWDWGLLQRMFDAVHGMGAKFSLDVFSSDNFTQPLVYPVRMPYCQPYAQSLPFSSVQYLMAHHGPACAGLRTHEHGFWYQWGIHEERAGRQDWLSNEIVNRMPAEANPYHEDMVEPFDKACADGGKWLMHCEPSMKPATVDTIRRFTDRYPATVVPAFANNLGNTVEQYWPVEIQPCVTPCTLGWGLSVQTWRWSADGYLVAYPDEFWAWVSSSAGAVLVEFSAAWTWWNLPGYRNGMWEGWGPQHDGRPTPLLPPLVDYLLRM